MAPTLSTKQSKKTEKQPPKSKKKIASLPTLFSKPLKRKKDTADSGLATEGSAAKKARKIEGPKQRTSQKTSKTSMAPPPARDDDSDDEPNGQEDSGQEGTSSDSEGDHLLGFSTDADSSDEDSDADDAPPEFDMEKLPTIAKDDETVKRKLEKAKRQPTDDRGVLFIGRLPHGFFEDQLRAYFSQFGDVTRLRVSRNKKTGKSKHYAFIEFDSSAVAKIVAETMDNYLIMGHILQCKLIPKEKVHPELWVGANRKWRVVPRDRIARVQHNKSRTEEEQKRAAKRLLRRQARRKRKLAELGINYDIDAAGYKKVRPAKV